MRLMQHVTRQDDASHASRSEGAGHLAGCPGCPGSYERRYQLPHPALGPGRQLGCKRERGAVAGRNDQPHQQSCRYVCAFVAIGPGRKRSLASSQQQPRGEGVMKTHPILILLGIALAIWVAHYYFENALINNAITAAGGTPDGES